MKDPAPGSASRPRYGPGSYLRCGACGRLLKIEWATRSVVCACGERLSPVPTDGKKD